MPFVVFATHTSNDGIIQKSGPVLIKAASLANARKRAEFYAQKLRSAGSNVSLLLMGDEPNGRPVYKIGHSAIMS